MKTSVKVALSVSLIWIILNLLIYLVGYSRAFFTAGILLNIFFLLCAVSLGLFLTKKEKGFPESLYLEDFKTAMQSGIIYTLLISGFIYLYHERIDTGIRQSLIEARNESLHQTYPDAASFKVLQDSDPKWKDKNFDLFIEEQEDLTLGIYSSFSVFIFHMMGLFIFSMFFSFFGTIIMRKIILRQ